MRAVHREKIRHSTTCYETQRLTHAFPGDSTKSTETQDTNHAFYPATRKHNTL